MGNAAPVHSPDAFREKNKDVKSLIFQGSGSSYRVKHEAKGVLYKFSIHDNDIIIKKESDDSTYFSMNKQGEVMDENGTKKGTITINRLMPSAVKGKLCFVFKSTEKDITLVR